ncbi:MAG TPA: hypothetical protein VEX88_02905 [Glaciibacter sp.]|nr:hypothetical protein [Glaciibacter sp.]
MRCWSVAVSISLIVLMSGCAQTSVPGNTPPTNSSADLITAPHVPATPVDADTSADAATIVVRATGLELVDSESDILTTLSFSEPVEDVVAELAVATGREPVIERYEGHDEAPPGTLYEWDGLRLYNSDRTIGGPPLYAEWSAHVTAATVGHLAVRTATTITAGMSQAGVDERAPGTLSVLVGSEVDGEMMRGTYEETEVGRDEEGSVLTHSVHVRLSGSPLAVTLILSPVRNWGDH